jgi:hypothetical protein
MDLKLVLKKKWFDLTKEGIKLEDYREINAYWISRLVAGNYKGWNIESAKSFMTNAIKRQFSTNIMTLGYPSNSDTERILKLEHAGIEIREGKPEWGAEPGKLYFVIKHGEIIK